MGILQARILEWVAMPSSRGSSQPRDQTHISCSPALIGGFFTSAPSRMLKKSIALFIIVSNWKLPKSPSAVERINRLRYIHTMEHCTPVKVNYLPLNSTHTYLFLFYIFWDCLKFVFLLYRGITF